jgi:hypothetical protein
MAALTMIIGTEEDSYAALSEYCEELQRNNSESTVVLECTEEEMTHRFKQVFIYYGASVIGFAFVVLCWVLMEHV